MAEADLSCCNLPSHHLELGLRAVIHPSPIHTESINHERLERHSRVFDQEDAASGFLTPHLEYLVLRLNPHARCNSPNTPDYTGSGWMRSIPYLVHDKISASCWSGDHPINCIRSGIRMWVGYGDFTDHRSPKRKCIMHE